MINEALLRQLDDAELPVAIPLPGLTVPPKVTSIPLLRDDIAKALDAALGPNKKGAIVAVAGHESATFAGAVKIGDHWTIGGLVNWVPGHVSGQVMLMASWP